MQQSGTNGMNVGQSNDKGLSPLAPREARSRAIDRPTPYGGSRSAREFASPSSPGRLWSLIGNPAVTSLASVVLQRAPEKPKVPIDPRGTPGHRAPLIKEPA